MFALQKEQDGQSLDAERYAIRLTTTIIREARREGANFVSQWRRNDIALVLIIMARRRAAATIDLARYSILSVVPGRSYSIPPSLY